MHQISRHGDSIIPQHPACLQFFHGAVEFSLCPMAAPPQPILSYNDAIAILRAFSMKMSREGYRQWFADISLTEDGGFVGDALISTIEDESVSLYRSRRIPSSTSPLSRYS